MRKVLKPTVDSHEAKCAFVSNHSPVRLWTFQHSDQLNVLQRDGLLRGNWAGVDPNDKAAYRYMCREMTNCGLDCGSTPPIWAWHSCGDLNKAPDSEVANMLLSFNQLAGGNIVLLSLDCPSAQYLVSCYQAWCDLVYFPLSTGVSYSDFYGIQNIEESEKQRRLFDIPLTAIEDGDLIQATLPVLRNEWLQQVFSVVLDKNDNALILNF